MITLTSPGTMPDELNDKSFTLRMPMALRDRLIAAKRVGLGSASQGAVLRTIAERYCEFVETMRRQPHDIEEVFSWALSKKAAKK